MPASQMSTKLPSNDFSAPGSLPRLPFAPRDHRTGIVITWTIVVANSCLLPIALVYGLWYGTSLTKSIIFAIVTSTFGVSSLGLFCVRMWKLLQKDGNFRPLGSRRGWLDFYQINNAICIAITATLLAVGTSRTPPSLALLSCPPSVLVVFISLQLVGFPILSAHTAFRVSSLPSGAPQRPAVYTILEDVMAVDASGGRAYRTALNERYMASKRFRRILWVVNYYWGGAGILIGGAVLGVSVWLGMEGKTAAFAIGWGVPWVWAGCWALVTAWWVTRQLRVETQESGQGGGGSETAEGLNV